MATDTSKIVAQVQTVDPVLARKWLAANPKNRKVKQNRVDELAAAIKRGEWRFDGSPIRFDETGKLLDGQHRLLAISEAGLPVSCLVIKGLPAEAQQVMDTGARRSFADNLQIDGEINPNVLASGCMILWRYENQAFGRNGFGKHPSYDQLYDVLERYKELRRSVSAANAMKKVRMPKAWIAAGRTIFLAIDESDTDGFFAELEAGTGLTTLDPVYKLREILNDNASQRTRKYPPEHLFALMIKSWNAWRDGKAVKLLTYRAGGASPEPFPIPR